MTAVSLAASQGATYNKISDYTVSINAPGSGDFEVRYNVTNANGANLRIDDIIWFLKGVIRQLEMGGTLVSASNTSDLLVGGGTLPPPAV
jgi:hypothetical protein